jgi:hypothetical protein
VLALFRASPERKLPVPVASRTRTLTQPKAPQLETLAPRRTGTTAENRVRLSVPDKSHLDELKREIKRGYAVTMADLKFLVRVLERAGL